MSEEIITSAELMVPKNEGEWAAAEEREGAEILDAIGVATVRRKRAVQKWTAEEDHRMTCLVREHGTRAWGLIASLLNEERSGKQCRERCWAPLFI